MPQAADRQNQNNGSAIAQIEVQLNVFAFSGISVTPAAPAVSPPVSATATDFALFFAQQLAPESLASQTGKQTGPTPAATAPATATDGTQTASANPEGLSKAEADAAAESALDMPLKLSDTSAETPQNSPVSAAEEPSPEPAESAKPAPAEKALQPPATKSWVWESWYWAQQSADTEHATADTAVVAATAEPTLTQGQQAIIFAGTAAEPVAAPAPQSGQTAEAPADEASTSAELPVVPAPNPAVRYSQLSTSERLFELPLPVSSWPVSLGPLALSQSAWLMSGSAAITSPLIFAASREGAPPVLSPDSLPATLQSLLEIPLMLSDIKTAAPNNDPQRTANLGAKHHTAFAPLSQHTLGSALQRQLGLYSLKAVLQQAQQSLRVQLEPAWLGKMTLQVQRGQDGLQIQIFADYLLTRELLEAQAGLLRQQLSDLGLIIASLRIGQGSTTSEDDDKDKDTQTLWHQGLPHSRGQPVFELDAGDLPGLLAEAGKNLPDISLIHFIV